MAAKDKPEVIIDGEKPVKPLAKLPADPPQNPLYAALTRALDSGKTGAELQEFMAFIKDAEKMNAEKLFNEAMTRCQAEMPAVVREAENAHTKARYARLEHIQGAIKPVYTRYGFALSFGTFESKLDKHVGVSCTCLHTGGYSREHRGEFPLDGAGTGGNQNKTGIQATGSTYSYARRYLTLMIFNVTITNEDNDGAGYSPPLNTDQVKELIGMIADVRKAKVPFDFTKFLAVFDWLPITDNNGQAYEADSLAQLRQSQFVEAVRGLNQKLRTIKGDSK